MASLFKLHSPFAPSGDQPQAIKKLVAQRPGASSLLGVTGSGKTFTLANVIAQQDKQVLIMSPNKTLAAQLYEEFSLFFPENKVCYFVSYYDYYQPESYLPAQDIYIPKETKINSEIERLRIEATASIINRQDTIIIASVSAIYSLGNPHDYKNLALAINKGGKMSRRELVASLIAIQYKRNDVEHLPGSFQVRGETVTINIPYLRDNLRIEFFGDEIEALELVDNQHRVVKADVDTMSIFPAKHFVTTKSQLESAVVQIKHDLEQELLVMEDPLKKERLRTRVTHDIDMLTQTGYCSGIENYSRYFEGRQVGDAPYCLFDFFEKDFLLIIDESHVAVPQMGAMYKGDRARKDSLIEYGFRLPSSRDNRPLKFEEIERFFKNVIYVSATPSPYELLAAPDYVEQIVRPTGIIDPVIEVRPREGQLDDLIKQIRTTIKCGFRTLVTVLTKRVAEELALYLEQQGLKVCYMHSDIKTPQRTELLQKLRLGIFDVLVGINLLREGLDLPEVALVAILDADIESFLRDKRSLIQTIGRAARNTQSLVILYGDKITKSMKAAMDETDRRRAIQQKYNEDHHITPESVQREVVKSISDMQMAISEASKMNKKGKMPRGARDLKAAIERLKIEMRDAAVGLNFEKAIELRDRLVEFQKQLEEVMADSK